MDTRKIVETPNSKSVIFDKPIFGWKCTRDGIYWSFSKTKQCKYCLPITEETEWLSLNDQ